ncbi:winged helix DNA-binding domain-containing protein [Brevibacterium sp. 91QC2O2]|uniref:winged helix DNA-binding domain-containing protein n=1 Tax=Brevibacterium TaxID=1696 RepID=UPI00211CD759|nr:MULTISPECIES: winged helix DNA-binding domain-containing protein [unclassified Brevibacterium]MCQ9368709.1 winged helix DNA-binding domain-containing protein [Brevibacterium sp. 91QC2O2]MCQ9386957.1 winged helix DNA-binding domain-containing protein [Brevibacterium sp. 68QC2CO]
MVNPTLVKARLVAQGLVGAGPASAFASAASAAASGPSVDAAIAHRPASPAEVVAGMGAMQGQDLPGVLSSIALRTGPRDVDQRIAEVVAAFAAGSLVRGYPMRGTVFALPGADAAWITELCAGPQRRAQPKRYERLGLSSEQVARSRDIFFAEAQAAASGQATASGQSPEGTQDLEGMQTPAAEETREDRQGAPGVRRGRLTELWTQAGLLEGNGTSYALITSMIVDGLAVYGPLVDGNRDNLVMPAQAWLPAGSDLAGRFNDDRDAATAELLLRYLSSHGPASLRDFQWWTKLPQRQIKAGFALIADRVEPAAPQLLGGSGAAVTAQGPHASHTVDMDTPLTRMGLADEVKAAGRRPHGTFLLPGFDEVVLGYRDRLAFMSDEHHTLLVPGNNGMFKKTMIRGGKFIGTWKAPRGSAGACRLSAEPFADLSAAALRDVERTFARYPHSD